MNSVYCSFDLPFLLNIRLFEVPLTSPVLGVSRVEWSPNIVPTLCESVEARLEYNVEKKLRLAKALKQSLQEIQRRTWDGRSVAKLPLYAYLDPPKQDEFWQLSKSLLDAYKQDLESDRRRRSIDTKLENRQATAKTDKISVGVIVRKIYPWKYGDDLTLYGGLHGQDFAPVLWLVEKYLNKLGLPSTCSPHFYAADNMVFARPSSFSDNGKITPIEQTNYEIRVPANFVVYLDRPSHLIIRDVENTKIFGNACQLMGERSYVLKDAQGTLWNTSRFKFWKPGAHFQNTANSDTWTESELFHKWITRIERHDTPPIEVTTKLLLKEAQEYHCCDWFSEIFNSGLKESDAQDYLSETVLDVIRYLEGDKSGLWGDLRVKLRPARNEHDRTNILFRLMDDDPTHDRIESFQRALHQVGGPPVHPVLRSRENESLHDREGASVLHMSSVSEVTGAEPSQNPRNDETTPAPTLTETRSQINSTQLLLNSITPPSSEPDANPASKKRESWLKRVIKTAARCVGVHLK
ncbi:hypothetical protein K438DRAFT_1775296 [Mycena galopus ATCC 62051]|nr:hypothetical protein K438DRAFT_1775296 [Mycena galopus ATCC 62051]